MNKRILYFILALIVIIITGLLIFANYQQPPAPVATNNASTPQQPLVDDLASSDMEKIDLDQPAPVDTDKITPTQSAEGTFSDETDVVAPDIAVFEISFSGIAFSPANLEIKNGDIVVFKNNSNQKFWPASNAHPSHTLYPAFDAKIAVEAGQSYQFKFTKLGTWGYHDHLAPSAKGAITVK